MDLVDTIEIVIANPQTAWVGYSLIILVLVTVAFGTMSGFLLKAASNIKDLLKLLRVKSTPESYLKQIKNESNITPLLNDIRIETQADRVLIMQYHNGVHSIANNSLLKLSLTHEIISTNTASVMNIIQNWPANYLSSLNEIIFNETTAFYPSIEDMGSLTDLKGAYEQFKEFKVKSMYCFPITDAKGKVFGIGMLHYTRQLYKPNNLILKTVKNRFVSIGTLLAGVVVDNYATKN